MDKAEGALLVAEKALELVRELASIVEAMKANSVSAQALDQVVKSAVAALTPPAGRDGADGTSVTIDDVRPLVERCVAAEVAKIPAPKDGKDGVGAAGAMIDREGSLLITLSNGEVKNLGPVVGRDGVNGQDGIGLDSFEMEYIEETHEVSLRASAAGRVKELRYPAGGIRPAGYWREGTKAKANEAWVHDGSLWIAVKDTQSKPDTKGDWIIAARKGRDGERGEKGQDGSPPSPIKLSHG